MKKASRKRSAHSKPEPSPDQISNYVRALTEDHHLAWSAELLEDAPEWVYMLGLHLRLVELEHLAEGAEELL